MSRCILKLAKDKFVEWSTVVDAPVTYVMTKKEALEFFDVDRVERADQYGSSALPAGCPAIKFYAHNRAGKNDRALTRIGLLRVYKYKEPTE